MTTEQAGKLWGVTPRRVSELCKDGRVNGAFKIGTSWVIPANTEKPKYARVTIGKWLGYKRKYNIVTVFDFSNPNTWLDCRNADDFRKQIQFVRAYDDCRSLHISDYTENGLQVPDKKDYPYRHMNFLENI